MDRFWGWVAFFAARRLGYTGWVPVNIDENNYALLLIPEGVTPQSLMDAISAADKTSSDESSVSETERSLS